MSQLDLIVLILFAISAGVGFLRGAVREVAAFIALFGAAFLAIWGLPSVTPLMGHVMHTRWLAAICSLVAIFGVTYVLLRLIGAGLARQVQKTQMLGTLDRMGGLAIGLVRGLVVLGGLYLLFNAATPEDLRPHWITGSASWPIAQATGHLETALAPRGLDLAGRLKPAFTHAAGEGDRNAASGYDARDRGPDDLETSP